MASSAGNAGKGDTATNETTKKTEQHALSSTNSKIGLREKHKATDDTNSEMHNLRNDDVLVADSAVSIDAMTKNQLVERLRQLKLPVTELKATLRERLRAATQEDVSDEDVSDEDVSDEEVSEDTVLHCDEDEGETPAVGHSGGRHDRGSLSTARRDATPPSRYNRMHYEEREPNPHGVRTGQLVLTYKDVEDALTLFSGDGTQNVGRWFTSFEETADLCRWTDVQKIIYAKRLLRGSAKLFVNFECQVQSYGALKKALIKEFGKTMNSRQVHKEVSAVSKKLDETYQAYVYRVLELASHTEMEIEAKIQYIIDGVKDEEINKSILYGATTIKELRQRFAQYEIQKSNRSKARQHSQAQSKKKPASNAGQTTTATAGKRCFNCGDTKHLGKECPNKAKGSKCYSCGEFGHIAAKCPKGADSANKDTTPVRVDALRSHSDKKTYKKVNILGKDVTAVYVHLGAPPIRHEITKFNGVGAFNRSTLGRFTADVSIDGILFTLDINIVPDDYTGHDLIIGGELSDLTEIRIRKRQAVIRKLNDDESKTTTEDANWAEVLCIGVQDNEEKEAKAQVTLNHVENSNIRECVRKLVEDYQPRKIKDSGVKMRLILKDEIPVHQNPRRLSAEQRNAVRKIIDEWIEKGIIRPSNSEYASPIVLVKKKDGTWRLCVDYRGINRKIVRVRQPFPLIENQLDELTDDEVYCVLDLKDGFFHVPLDEDSIRHTAFVTPDGQYEFLMAPFGLCNSPAAFQQLMRAIFKMVKTYLDDVIISAKNEKECLAKLEQVLNVARDYGLRINRKKCKLLVRRVEYLGHIVEAGT
ncbi:uncharacterized protein K02A2.6-like, partial [Temnothorax curvispinosus]|uniref:Uncharacterized protein K02A2.6-like n=1 Tax=Temnothorax curvispinosus TaxID=300111 RepID=A0A6J1RAK1_9HYME